MFAFKMAVTQFLQMATAKARAFHRDRESESWKMEKGERKQVCLFQLI